MTQKFRLGVAGAAVAIGLGLPTAASAQSLYTGTPTPDAGQADTSVRSGSTFAPASVRAQGSGGLALTGIDVVELGLLGLGATGIGAVLVRRARRPA